MQVIFNILELNKRIVEGVVEVVESDDKSELLVKLKTGETNKIENL